MVAANSIARFLSAFSEAGLTAAVDLGLAGGFDEDVFSTGLTVCEGTVLCETGGGGDSKAMRVVCSTARGAASEVCRRNQISVMISMTPKISQLAVESRACQTLLKVMTLRRIEQEAAGMPLACRALMLSFFQSTQVKGAHDSTVFLQDRDKAEAGLTGGDIGCRIRASQQGLANVNHDADSKSCRRDHEQ